jgi:carboxypeptidase C (cathepsin A)
MARRTFPLIAAVLLALALSVPLAFAEAPARPGPGPRAEAATKSEAAKTEAAKPDRPGAAAAALPADKAEVTHHTINAGGRVLAYRATAGVLPVTAEGIPEARMFYVSYELDGADKTRPVAFVFNGGPGAASAYLQLGAVGPRRLVLNDDGTVPPPPARFVDNPLTWLAFADLVFIDPVGTGFSRGVGGKDEKADERAFFGSKPDIETLARFIRLYLTRNDRWLSPKFLVGESYGGFRVAALSNVLQSSYGVALNGALMISPVLAFGLSRVDGYQPLPWALKLPSYAATALQLGRSSLPKPAGAVDRKALTEVEAWSLGGYLTALAAGDTLAGPAEQTMLDKVAGYTGLPKQVIARRHGRIPIGAFAKALLRDQNRVLSLYDGSVSTIDSNPESPNLNDRSLEMINAALGPAFNAYLRGELKFETDLPYLVLNEDVSRQWRWSDRSGRQSNGSALEDLKAGMSFNPRLKVLIAHGLFDLVTPYFASAYAIDQLYLDPAVRANIALKTYAAGHMIYTHSAAREALARDAEAFFRDATAPAVPTRMQ